MLPIEVDNFAELATYKNSEGEKYTFIDKTLFIKDFIESGDKISLVTRPRRFGKTLKRLSQHGTFSSTDQENFGTLITYAGANDWHGKSASYSYSFRKACNWLIRISLP